MASFSEKLELVSIGLKRVLMSNSEMSNSEMQIPNMSKCLYFYYLIIKSSSIICKLEHFNGDNTFENINMKLPPTLVDERIMKL